MSQTTFFVPLADHGLIRASGEDAANFLHNLLTNDIAHLEPSGVRQAALCTAKGRMIASFTIWRENNLAGGPDDYLLLLSADILPGILKKLSMYVLRSKVKLADITAERSLIGVAGPNAEELIGTLAPMTSLPFAGGTAIRIDARRFVLALPADNATAVHARLAAAARAGTSDDWRLAEIEAGMPRIVAATQEAFTPQMVNYELEAVGGVSFQKGCYPGQEIVARTQYLGKVKRRMYRAKLDSVFPPGTDVFTPEAGEQHCGAVVLCAPAPAGGCEALLVVQSSGAEANAVHVGKPDGPHAQILPLPYAID
ncbi:MAG: folate-binding protein YgfZ [Pseudomonadota bacterium]